MNILWAKKAERDLLFLFEYLAEKNIGAAYNVEETIVYSVERLVHFPYSGKLGRIAKTREIILTKYPYIIVYKVNPHLRTVYILRVFHGMRDREKNIS